MGPTGYGDSSYQSFSTYAGNQYFIDLENACNTPEQIFARALKMADKTIESLKKDNAVLME